MFFFFFSSRRRHTRLQGDWSSDVCSSDLCPASPRLLHGIHEQGCSMNFDPLAGLSGQSVQQFWNEQWSRTLQTLQQLGQPGLPGTQGMPGMPDMAQAWKAAVPEPGALPERSEEHTS